MRKDKANTCFRICQYLNKPVEWVGDSISQVGIPGIASKSELARVLDRSRSSISEAVDYLCAKGILEQVPSSKKFQKKRWKTVNPGYPEKFYQLKDLEWEYELFKAMGVKGLEDTDAKLEKIFQEIVDYIKDTNRIYDSHIYPESEAVQQFIWAIISNLKGGIDYMNSEELNKLLKVQIRITRMLLKELHKQGVIRFKFEGKKS